MLIVRGAPKQLWGEAVSAEVFAYNRTLCSSTGRAPFERWNGYKPDLRSLRLFDSLYYVNLHKKAEAEMINAPSKRLYAADQRGWLVLDYATNRASASVHVSFDESDTDAAAELKLVEYDKLMQCTLTAFDFYSRMATPNADLLFFGRRPESEKPSPDGLVMLEKFVSKFDL
ncbi:hypothetical protein PybrP1_003774 [[Pythium] brassicae (nom. inval.)]|nr:hypothetical protein PybrP1_003774 [[Pythium] brassicae (nom. inval.)]